MSIYKLANRYIYINMNEQELDIAWKAFRVFENQKGLVGEMCDFYFSRFDLKQFTGDIKIGTTKNCTKVMSSNNHILLTNTDYSIAYVQNSEKDTYNIFLCYIFYTHAVQRHMLQFHSSLISHQNSGTMFLGPSGIGKTTQAELWNQYRDALIINGDIVFVQETEKEFLGWGTPWHGSSPYCENTSVPLRAMVVLKQAKENSIRELTGFEKVSEVSNHVFYPRWLENGMELCLETLDHLLTAIPVYELSCRPDEDAVRLTEETIFGT